MHPFRANVRGKRLGIYKQMPTWAAIRDEKEDWWQNYYVSHHIHLFGYVRFMDPPEKGEKFGYKNIMNDGKVVNFIRKAKRRTEMRRVVRYLLTHTGYFVDDLGKMESYKGIGNCSKKAFKVTKEEIEGEISRKRKMKPCLRCDGALAGLWYVFSTRSFDIKEGLDLSIGIICGM